MGNEFIQKILASEIRRLLATAAGALVVSGYLKPDQIDSASSIAVATLLYGASSAWGWFKNRKAQNVENIALEARPLETMKAQGKL